MTLTVLDLFSGIGGFSIGLERAGFRTVAFCEIEPYPRAVLARHWPEVPQYDDIQSLTAERLVADGIRPDVICGGFPCQDISLAGAGAGITGPQSSLWGDHARLISELLPRYVLVENVAALLGRGLSDVLGDLAALGYDAEWHCIPASAIGAPHRRDRIWIVGYPAPGGRRVNGYVSGAVGSGADAGQPAESGPVMAHAGGQGLPGAECAGWCQPIITPTDIGRAVAQRHWRYAQSGVGGEDARLPGRAHRYPVEPEPWEGDTLRTVGPGYPDRRQRLMALGNSIVPQIAELIGRAIMRREGMAA